MTREEIVNKLLEGGKLLPVMTEFEAREVVNYVLDNYYQQAHVVQPDYTYNSKEFLEKKIEELSHPSLPSNIDEVMDEEAQYAYGEPTAQGFAKRSFFKRGFKAGAEWMADQGYTQEGIAYPDFLEIWVNMNNTDIKDGDKVIVHIRKINEKDE